MGVLLRRSSPSLLAAAVLAVASLPLLTEAQGYWVVYTSDCPYVCSYANPSYAYSGYSTCVNQCNTCLLYYGCYSSFYPYFSTVNGTLSYVGAYSCGCYWPWWAWTCLGVGLFIIVCICLPMCAIYCCCKGIMSRGKKNTAEAAVMPPQETQPYPQGPVPYPQGPVPYPQAPDAYAAPPPPDGKYAV